MANMAFVRHLPNAMQLQKPWHLHDVANAMACAIIGSRLDYCNSIFYGMSLNFDKLQRVQNRAARIVCGVGRRQQSARQLRHSLHWLPVRARTDFQLATLSYKSQMTGQPGCRTSLLSTTALSTFVVTGTVNSTSP